MSEQKDLGVSGERISTPLEPREALDRAVHGNQAPIASGNEQTTADVNGKIETQEAQANVDAKLGDIYGREKNKPHQTAGEQAKLNTDIVNGARKSEAEAKQQSPTKGPSI